MASTKFSKPVDEEIASLSEQIRTLNSKFSTIYATTFSDLVSAIRSKSYEEVSFICGNSTVGGALNPGTNGSFFGYCEIFK